MLSPFKIQTFVMQPSNPGLVSYLHSIIVMSASAATKTSSNSRKSLGCKQTPVVWLIREKANNQYNSSTKEKVDSTSRIKL